MMLKFARHDNEVIAIGAYKGKTVKAKAICDASGTFNYETGKELAEARLIKKIMEKRIKNTEKKLNAAKKAFDEATARYKDLLSHVHDLKINLYQQEAIVAGIENTLA